MGKWVDSWSNVMVGESMDGWMKYMSAWVVGWNNNWLLDG